MKPAFVLLGWSGVAAIALATRWVCEHGVERLGGSDSGAGATHLAAQSCDEASLVLTMGADPVELSGVLRARVTSGSAMQSVALVVGAGVVVDRVALGGREATPPRDLFAGLIARPRSLASRRVDEAVATPADLEVRFRAPLDGANLPAFVEPTRFVRVTEPMRFAKLTVEIPAGGALVARSGKAAESGAKGGTRAARGDRLVELGEGRHELGPCDDSREPLLFGHADVRDGGEWLASQQFVAARGRLPTPATEAGARTIVERGLGERSLPPRTLALLGGEAARDFVRREPSWCAAPPPRDATELALALLEAAAPPAPQGDELARALAPALAVFGLSADAASQLLESAPATVPPAERAGLRAWLALEFAFGSRARQAARDWWHALAAGSTDRPPFLAEEASAAVVAWALAGCDVRFERLRLDSRGSRSELRGELVVEPPPPAGASFKATLLFVGPEKVQVELLQIAGGRTPLSPIALRETPLLIGVDPGHRLPRRDSADVVFPLHFMKTAFAIAGDASALAVVVAHATADEGGAAGNGVLVLEAGPDARLSGRSWTPISRSLSGLEWVAPRRVLALDERGGGRALLNLSDGSIERVGERILVAPRGGAYIGEVERAPGCFAHVVHDLRSGLERPLPSLHQAPVAWVRGAEEIVTQAADGRAAVLDLRGRERFTLPWLAASVRDVRHFDTIGYALVTEAVDGSRIALRRQDGSPIEELEVPGRLRGWSFFEATSFFYLVAEVGPRLHVVARARYGGGRAIELYRGADRPLGDTLTPKGVVLVDAESDAAPPGDPRRLLFLPFDAEGEAERAARQVCAEAFLDPPPVLASAGRYLYYLRAEGGPRGLPGEQRPRSLQRYDFLTGREDSLEGL